MELPATLLVDALLSLEELGPSSSSYDARHADLLSRLSWTISIGFDEVHALTYLFPLAQEAPFHPIPLSPSERELRSAAASISDELLAQARVLIMPQETLDKLKRKDKLPSSRIEAREDVHDGSIGVAEIVVRAIELRLAMYPTTVEENREKLYGEKEKSMTERMRSSAGDMSIDQEQDESQITTTLTASPLSIRRRNALVVRTGEQCVLQDNLRVLRAADEASRKIQRGQGITAEKRKDVSGAGSSKKIRK